MKTIKFLFSDLNTDERQILGGGIVALFGFALLIWLMSTNTPPRLDHATTDPQTFKTRSYELKGIYKQYAQGVYNRSNEQ
jgi:hypothetical protein